MSQKDSSTAYFSEPEEVLSWTTINEGGSSAADALKYLKMGVSTKRKRYSDPKSFPQTERRRKQRGHSVDDMELCAKRMKCMSLRSPKKKEVNPFDIDVGYEGDSEG
ncbi:hypothetical protein KR032_001238 [Drosophila birchii]|nr:hypothetical protein KR032_001238 [Drosophila birchii]